MLPPDELQEAVWWAVGAEVVARVVAGCGAPATPATALEDCRLALASEANADNRLLHALWAETKTWHSSGSAGFVRAHNNFRREAARVAAAAAKGDWANAAVAEATAIGTATATGEGVAVVIGTDAGEVCAEKLRRVIWRTTCTRLVPVSCARYCTFLATTSAIGRRERTTTIAI